MNSGEYAIRKARTGDLPRLPDIERAAAKMFEAFPDMTGLTNESLSQVTSDEAFARALMRDQLWVAVDRTGRPVGFAFVRELGRTVHLQEMDVLPEHGRKGIGTRLLNTVCDWAGEKGYETITLTTFRDIPWNAPFYARQGFKIVQPETVSPDHVRLMESEIKRGFQPDKRVLMVK
ncbi:MAG: GNAT family N-acetyltransferase [Planctomycetes bacterium]|nr:GNAT family N-acetyltransferase [Planctomycetota bacterium]